jgi:nucleoside-diphosphate-sugar epimerase
VLGAYLASKKIAFNATEAFIRDKKPKFEVVSVGPGFIVGRDDTITDPKNIGNGSNRLLISRLLGNGVPIPASSCIAHIDDVAKVHVESLNEAITGNPFFMITTQYPEGPNWDDALEIVKRRYPKEVADGVFHTTSGAPTHHVLIDSSFTEKTFGIRFKTYEQAVVDVVNHYLELTGRK